MGSQVQVVVLHQMPRAEVFFLVMFRNALDWLEILALRLIKIRQDDFDWDLYFRQDYGLCLAPHGTWYCDSLNTSFKTCRAFLHKGWPGCRVTVGLPPGYESTCTSCLVRHPVLQLGCTTSMIDMLQHV